MGTKNTFEELSMKEDLLNAVYRVNYLLRKLRMEQDSKFEVVVYSTDEGSQIKLDREPNGD